MPKVNRKKVGFCSGNSALPFVNTGDIFREKYFSMVIAVLGWRAQSWNVLFISKYDFHVRTRKNIFYDLDGNKRQKRQAAHKELLAVI